MPAGGSRRLAQREKGPDYWPAAGQATNRLSTPPDLSTPWLPSPPPAPPLQVIAQCQHCDAWHKLADAANLVEEIRYADLLEEEGGEDS